MYPGKKHNFNFGEIEILAPDVLLINYSKSNIITLEDILEVSKFRKEQFGEDIKYYSVTDLTSGIITISKEAKKYAAENPEIAKRRHLDILILDNWATRLELSFYFKFNRPLVKTKVATSLEHALSIIEKHRDMQPPNT